jgi:phosphoglycerate dehydrogenase-like enzyme
MQHLPVDVLITLPFPISLVTKLQAVSPRLRVTVSPAKKAEDIPQDLWGRCEVLYTTRILPTAELAPNLHWIQFHYAGVDHAIDASILTKSELIVTTLSGAAAPQMAEYILTMLLALGHHLPALAQSQRKSDWPKDRWERFSPRELRGSTVGIVGYGSIGRQVAHLLREFGATVFATKRNAKHPADNGYTPEGLGDPQGDLIYRLYPSQALRSMVKECDFVIVTVPLTPETRGLIDAEVLAKFKPTACLIDVSRGGIVDHSALSKALQEHKLAGAALDVFPNEPLPGNSPLWKMHNVILTPHIAGNSPQYDERAVQLFAENLNRYLSGLPLYNVYDPERGY